MNKCDGRAAQEQVYDQRVSAYVHVCGITKAVYMSHLGKDVRENISTVCF